MGRNDPCFCGSGLKLKKCHPDVHEDSIAGRLYKLYRRIDTEISEFQRGKEDKVMCRHGCTACCSNIFRISNTETDVIVRELRKWDQERLDVLIGKIREAWELFENRYPAAAKRFSSPGPDDALVYKDLSDVAEMGLMPSPCPFLFDDSCSIYAVRPIVCRLYGTTTAGAINGRSCNVMDSPATEWQYDATHLVNDINQFSMMYSKKHNAYVPFKMTFMLRAMYNTFFAYGFGIGKIPFEDESFIMPYDRFADIAYEYYEAMGQP